MIILQEVPLLEIENKLPSGNIYSKECCLQIIKDIINKDIRGCIHYVDESANDNICLTLSNPYVNVVEIEENYEDKNIIILFCSVEIDETKLNEDIIEKLKTNPFRLYPYGMGGVENDIITEYEILGANIEIKNKI